MSSGSEDILQFAPWESFVSPTFWHKLAELKLDYDRLSDAQRSISGHYTNRKATGCLLEADYTSFNSNGQPPKFSHAAVGTIYNKNTIEEFKALDKLTLLSDEGKKLLSDMCNDRVAGDPSLLTRFFVLSFADLKCHSYYYWFAFPCPLTPTLKLQGAVTRLSDLTNSSKYAEALQSLAPESQNFFILYVNGRQNEVVEARSLSSLDESEVEHYYFGFADPSEYEHPAWLMRNYAAYLLQRFPCFVGKTLRFLGLRYNQQMQMDDSLIWNVVQSEACDLTKTEDVKFVGWELNKNGKMGPRMVCMRDSMDPAKLAENSINLNLKLMKWRLVPDLNLEIISQTKCLLFGAGTLGCAVARNLLSWGFKRITLMDSGKVGFSNPVRQNLYTHADAVAGNRMKATTAAQRLRDINPSAETVGHVLEIPMPGHTIGESLRAQTKQSLQLIEQQVQAHDVIFLLTDSRESRWLPTLLGAAYQKIVINAALGFDSYLVMRHGSTRDMAGDSGREIEGLKCISGNQLGCYFCNDVTAPGNTSFNGQTMQAMDSALDTLVVVARVLLESGARGIARLQMVHASDLHNQTLYAGHFEAHQVHHGVGRAPGIAEEVVSIHSRENFAFRKGQGQLELLIECERKTPMALFVAEFKVLAHGVSNHQLLVEADAKVQLLPLGVRIHELDDELAPLVLEAARCYDNHMARTEEYGLIVAEGLEVVRGVYGGPRIGEDGAMIHLLDHLDLVAYLQGPKRTQRHAVAELTELPTVDRNVKAVLAGQYVDHKELAAHNRIRQRYVVHDGRLLLAPDAVHAGIAHDHVVAEVAGKVQTNVSIRIHGALGCGEVYVEPGGSIDGLGDDLQHMAKLQRMRKVSSEFC